MTCENLLEFERKTACDRLSRTGREATQLWVARSQFPNAHSRFIVRARDRCDSVVLDTKRDYRLCDSLNAKRLKEFVAHLSRMRCAELARLEAERAKAVTYLEGVRRLETYTALEAGCNSQILSFDLVIRDHVSRCSICIANKTNREGLWLNRG